MLKSLVNEDMEKLPIRATAFISASQQYAYESSE